MIYLFRKPGTSIIKEISQGMKEEHIYAENGEQWERVYTLPQVSFDTQIGGFDQNKFLDKTRKNGTVGDLFNMSKEASDKRIAERGFDPIKDQYKKDYEAKRPGTKFMEVGK